MSPAKAKGKRPARAPRASPLPEAPPASASLVIRPSFDPDHRVVAITGAHGYLGSQIIRRLEGDRRYHKVLAIDIRKPDLPLGKTQFHKVDLTLPNADVEVAHVLKREEADTLVHLAFLSHPTHNASWAHELEAIGSLHVLNACAACKVHKVVMWSLAMVYGPHPLNPNFLDEQQKLNGVPNSRFFGDKIEAERLARRFRKENPASIVTILRTSTILGRQIKSYFSNYFSLPVAPVLLGYDPLLQLLHEEDAVAAFKLAIDADFNGTYNIAGDGVLPLHTVLALLGRPMLPLPHFLAFPLAKALWMTQILDAVPAFLDFLRYLCVVDTGSARREMGFSPRYNIQQIVSEFAAPSRRPDGHLEPAREA
jgi:UDP-glucose 4-epimerase